MSRLLQRLAGGASGAVGSRIRPAAAVHAQVPIALPSREPRGTPHERPAIEGASFRTAAASDGPADPVVRPSPAQVHGIAAAHAREEGDRLPVDGSWIVPAPVVERADWATPSVHTPPAQLLREIEIVTPAALPRDVAASAADATVAPIRPAVVHEMRTALDRQPTEVHVHIGRIEVTALQAAAAPAPKRRERPARQSLPLSEYLAKRRSP